jgi:hemoglobin
MVQHALDARPDPTLFDLLGGRPTLERVHKTFYDKLYAHPWLKGFFVEVGQSIIESQQTDFMAQAFGGPNVYCGKFPVIAHRHMFITAEAFDLRHSLLEQSLIENGVAESLRVRWLKVDGAFKARLVKGSVDECQGRFKTEPILVVAKPE